MLGEQSAKSLRGIKMEDVIFAGTRDRKPTGMAEVSLTLVDPEVYDGASAGRTSRRIVDRRRSERELDRRLGRDRAAQADAPKRPKRRWPRPSPAGIEMDEEPNGADQAGRRRHSMGEADAEADAANPNNVVLKIRRRKFGRAPVRAGEMTITRRLFRSGDSEYLLNGKICRLRDIQDIFMGTGLGGETYAIIGQERIGQLLSSKPHRSARDHRRGRGHYALQDEEAAGGAAAGVGEAEPCARERHL